MWKRETASELGGCFAELPSLSKKGLRNSLRRLCIHMCGRMVDGEQLTIFRFLIRRMRNGTS
jgi:hypothetical protein